MSWDDDDWETSNIVLPGAPKKEVVAPETFSDDEEVVEDDEPGVEGPKPKNEDNKKLKPKKKTKQQEENARKAQLEAEEDSARRMKAMTTEEKMAEKLRLQKLVEESDNKLTTELFAVKKEEGVFDEDTVAATLQTIPLQSEEHFKNFASAIVKRLELEDKQIQTREFAKSLIRGLGPLLTTEDFTEIDGLLSVIKNTKVKNLLNKKKKKTAKKFATVSRDMFDLDDSVGAAASYGYEDSYDFM